MSTNYNRKRLFFGCCLALTVTAMTFAIRAGILADLGVAFKLDNTHLGWINAMAFLGFPIATMFGGFLYNFIGAKKLVMIAFVGHVLGLVLTITAEGFWTLLISSFFIGFANGSIEAACNPLIADMYHKNKTIMLNRFHVWFPGGIVVGAVCTMVMTDLGFDWQALIAIMLLPTMVYGYLIFTQDFPETDNIDKSTKNNLRGLTSPLFLFMAFCMTLTATSELGTQQWIEKILGASGASPMVILALISGVMAFGRYFAGPVINKLNTVGVLLYSAVLTTIGIYAMSVASGYMVYGAALLFALGVTYFWPTMIGFVADELPETGALGMSMIGGVGMFGVSMWNPVIGQWIDKSLAEAELLHTNELLIQQVAGQATLSSLAIFPTVLIFSFIGLIIYMRTKTVKVHK